MQWNDFVMAAGGGIYGRLFPWFDSLTVSVSKCRKQPSFESIFYSFRVSAYWGGGKDGREGMDGVILDKWSVAVLPSGEVVDTTPDELAIRMAEEVLKEQGKSGPKPEFKMGHT